MLGEVPAGVGVVKIELPAKIAPRSRKFNLRVVGKEKEESICQHFASRRIWMVIC